MKTPTTISTRPVTSDHSTAALKEIFAASQAKIIAEFSFGYSMVNTTAMQLLDVREKFMYRAKYMANDLLNAAEKLDQRGHSPNSCGETQNASQLESYNGQIHALTQTLNTLLSEYPL